LLIQDPQDVVVAEKKTTKCGKKNKFGERFARLISDG
jgi:hypothetical protein